MIEQEILSRLQAQDELLLKIHRSVEQTRRYFMWTLILTVMFFILPFIGIFFAGSAFLKNYIALFNI